ncbi:MAG TPA: DNA-processing protein DprA [Candidatus Polarisedimenticolaceae bacterium]|nr:DNA-processing protein DprA [Candidatus Polarisedimenticolaceae bacterium]
MPPERLVPWIALSLLPGVGPITARRAIEAHGDPYEVAFRLPARAWRELPGIDGDAVERILSARPTLARRVEAEWDAAVRSNARIVTREDGEFPSLLAALPDAPCVLYLRGTVSDPAVRIAVVGSRRATAYGRAVAQSLAGELAERGIEIVSGGARGIDSCAHRGALDAGGRTIAVLGSGLGRSYPPENTPLFERIERGGALVSEFPIAMPPLAENFPRRNRLISALSAATVVVEATDKSGSLITAGHALEQGREVMAVPGPITSEQSRGCHRLLQQGAKLVQCAEDIIEELSPIYRNAISPTTAAGDAPDPCHADLAPDERAVLALFDDPRPVHVDRLAESAPFGIARLQAALFALSLRGCVEPLSGGYYVARPRAGSPRS